MRIIVKRLLTASVLVCVPATISSTIAADYPEKPVTMIINGGADGSTSGGARILAKAMEGHWASRSSWSPSLVVRAPRARC